MRAVVIKAGPGPRQAAAQPARTYGVKSLDLTNAWGAQPGSAIVTYVGPPALQGAQLSLEGGGHQFWGLCRKIVATQSSEGNLTALEFVDMRELLHYDDVYGWFNRRKDLLVNGVWTKYYSHLLPRDFGSSHVTYTASPYTAAQVLDFLFTAPTVRAPWSRLYHPAQLAGMVYDVDCSGGRKLADVVTEVSQKQGMVFALIGGMYALQWCRKGDGWVPASFADFPANSDHRRLGEALSGKPTCVTVLGSRNRYQVLNIPMVPDWNDIWYRGTSSLKVWGAIGGDRVIYGHWFQDAGTGLGGWIPDQTTWKWTIPPPVTAAKPLSATLQTFEADFERFIFDNLTDPISGKRYNAAVSGDPEFVVGHTLAAARAETITVGEFADWQDTQAAGSGEQYRDRRKFNGRTRLDMPVILYVRLLIHRAYRLPDDFSFVNAQGANMGPLNVRILETALVEATYDYVTGAMQFQEATTPGGNGLAIAQGFNFFHPPPVTFKSDRFDLGAWQNTQDLWQRAEFHADDSGDQVPFVVFDQPILKSSNVMTEVDGHAVMNAAATFDTPAVRCALVFEGEPFQYTAGEAGVSHTENAAGLAAEYVLYYGDSALVEEVAFADGETATEKAAAIADSLLEQQPVYVEGGYTVRGSNGTPLTPTTDRVRWTLDADRGEQEEVDFTNERSRNAFEPERDFERRIALVQLAPGQAELRQDARERRALGAALRHSPKFLEVMLKAFHDRFGSGSVLTDVTVPSGTGTLAAGAPLFKAPTVVVDGKPTNTTAVMPVATTAAHTEFCGVTVQQNQPVTATGSLTLQREGHGLARVMGPASAGDTLVQSAGNDYLVSAAVGADGAPAVGVLLQDVPDAAAHLVKVNFAGAGGGSSAASPQTGMVYRGDWVSDTGYGQMDVVTVRSGVNAGTYVALVPVASGGSEPSNGVTWAILSNQDLLSVWR